MSEVKRWELRINLLNSIDSLFMNAENIYPKLKFVTYERPDLMAKRLFDTIEDVRKETTKSIYSGKLPNDALLETDLEFIKKYIDDIAIVMIDSVKSSNPNNSNELFWDIVEEKLHNIRKTYNRNPLLRQRL